MSDSLEPSVGCEHAQLTVQGYTEMVPHRHAQLTVQGYTEMVPHRHAQLTVHHTDLHN